MARKKASALKLAGIVGGVSAFVLIALGAFFFFGKEDTFAKVPPLPVDAYLSGENLWSYDEYLVSGRVDNVIYRSRTTDRVIASIHPTDSRVRLPLVIEVAPGKKSIQLEQELTFKVTLGPNRELLCREYKPL